MRPLQSEGLFPVSGTISLSINQEVTVTESYIPEFSFATFMADLGGSLGLWLGVGAVQIISAGAAALTWIKRICFTFQDFKNVNCLFK